MIRATSIFDFRICHTNQGKYRKKLALGQSDCSTPEMRSILRVIKTTHATEMTPNARSNGSVWPDHRSQTEKSKNAVVRVRLNRIPDR